MCMNNSQHLYCAYWVPDIVLDLYIIHLILTVILHNGRTGFMVCNRCRLWLVWSNRDRH